MKIVYFLSTLLIYGTMLTGCTYNSNKSVYFSYVYMAIAIISLLLFSGYLFFVKNKNRNFDMLFLSVFVVNTGYWLISVANSLEFALWANRISYFGSVFLPLSMVLIIADACNLTVKKFMKIILLLISLSVFLIAASQGFCDLYYKAVSLDYVNGTAILVKTYGPLHFTYLLYLVCYFVFMIYVIIYSSSRKYIESHKYAISLIGVVAINMAVWFFEQIFKVDFEFLSVAYIVTELYLLNLCFLERDNKYIIKKEDIPEIEVEEKDELFETGKQINENLALLTPTEKKIYELYCSGKKTAEVIEILGIKETTLKFHNTNIYGKLGVKSRKQLLECIRHYQKHSCCREE